MGEKDGMGRMKRVLLGVIITVGLFAVMAQNRPAQNVGLALWDGTAFQLGRMASLSNFALATATTARNQIGGQISEKGSRWSAVSQPAANSQATASIAAEAGVRHVADCIGFSADSAAAITAANVTVNLRDGATGAGTVIWTYSHSLPTAAALGVQEVPVQHLCGLNLVGTTNTAMTFEFSAGVTGSIESANLSGYNIN